MSVTQRRDGGTEGEGAGERGRDCPLKGTGYHLRHSSQGRLEEVKGPEREREKKRQIKRDRDR